MLIKIPIINFYSGEISWEERDLTREELDPPESFEHIPHSWKEAKFREKTQYFDFIPCKRGHLCNKFVNPGMCVECNKIRKKEERLLITEEEREKERCKARNYRANNLELIKKRTNEYLKKKRKENLLFKLNCYISSSISTALRYNKQNKSWKDFANFTIEELIIHLESQFRDGMTWENYGWYWHLDHIKPKSLCETIQEAWKLENLQPLLASENLEKGNRYIGNPNNPQWVDKKGKNNDYSI